MKHTFKIAGVIALEVVIIALLVGLAVGTIWLFHYGKGKDWSTWVWILVLLEGIGALFFIPVGLMMSFTFTKEKIREIKEENKLWIRPSPQADFYQQELKYGYAYGKILTISICTLPQAGSLRWTSFPVM